MAGEMREAQPIAENKQTLSNAETLGQGLLTAKFGEKDGLVLAVGKTLAEYKTKDFVKDGPEEMKIPEAVVKGTFGLTDWERENLWRTWCFRVSEQALVPSDDESILTLLDRATISLEKGERPELTPFTAGSVAWVGPLKGKISDPVLNLMLDVYDASTEDKTETRRSLVELSQQILGDKTISTADRATVFAEITGILKTQQPRLDTNEQEARSDGYRIITSETAEKEFNSLPNNYPAREAWVREKLAQIMEAGKPSGGFVGANFAPYQLLSGADRAIKVWHRDLWGEIHHTFGLMDLGAGAKSAVNIKDILSASGGISAETFGQLFRVKIHRATDGKEIYGVAEAMRLFEKHRLDLALTHPDNNGSFMTAIAWELEGHSWATARAMAADPTRPFPPNMWAAMDAESFWHGTMRGIVPVVDPKDGKEKRNSTFYPAFRLATLKSSNKTVVRFFREEGEQYMKPFLVDFWQYIGEAALNDDGTAKEVSKSVNEPLTQNYIDCGLLIPSTGGKYVVPQSLENVRFEKLIFSENSINVVKGIGPKFYAFASTTDNLRDATEPGGFYNSPSMRNFTELVVKTGLWKNLDPRPRREEAYCFIAEGIIEFTRKRNFFFPRSYSERDTTGNFSIIDDKQGLIIEMGKLLGPPFNIPLESSAFVKLYSKLGLSRGDFQAKRGIRLF